MRTGILRRPAAVSLGLPWTERAGKRTSPQPPAELWRAPSIARPFLPAFRLVPTCYTQARECDLLCERDFCRSCHSAGLAGQPWLDLFLSLNADLSTRKVSQAALIAVLPSGIYLQPAANVERGSVPEGASRSRLGQGRLRRCRLLAGRKRPPAAEALWSEKRRSRHSRSGTC